MRIKTDIHGRDYVCAEPHMAICRKNVEGPSSVIASYVEIYDWKDCEYKSDDESSEEPMP